ncbi:MAG: hypothetical protein IH602_06365 [Bryobacteraceae bacterium]|nr:hypothetical protein [Bryobacteraceae bacterium]
MPITKNPAAVALGRKGGLKGGPARAASLTPAERSESARNAVQARWARVKSQRKSTEVSETETSDAALLNLLDKVKSSTDPVEIRGLVDQIERVVFHKQMTDA